MNECHDTFDVTAVVLNHEKILEIKSATFVVER